MSTLKQWIQVTGDRELITKLDRIAVTDSRRIARAAVRDGLKPLVAAAKRNAPKGEYGLLKKSIKSQVTSALSGRVFVDPDVMLAVDDSNGNSYRVKLSGTKRAKKKLRRAFRNWASENGYRIIRSAAYAHIVEFGRRNPISRRGRYGKMHKNVGTTQPQPFMRKARDGYTREAFDAIENRVRKEFESL